MNKQEPSRVTLTHSELELQLQDQISFLSDRCNAFDRGQTNEAKRIATTLRILLHDTRKSKSLLGQIGLKYKLYYDSSQRPQEGGEQLLTPLSLVGRLAGNHTHAYSPHFGLPQPGEELSFDTWWDQVVIVDKESNEFSRELIILSIADQDGGAHVDAALGEAYYKLTRLNSVQDFQIFLKHEPTVEEFINASPVAPKVSPAFYTARQIAHELLVSLLEYKRIPSSYWTTYIFNEDYYSGASFAHLGIHYE